MTGMGSGVATADVNVDCFAVFGLPPVFAQDPAELERRYLDLQRGAHPDRHAHRDAAQRRVAVEVSARINAAYCLLRDPIARSAHLLALRGIDLRAATDLPRDFLATQIDWHEALERARRNRDPGLLAALCDRFDAERARLETRLGAALDQHGDPDEAVVAVRQLQFLRRLIETAQLVAEGEMP